MKLKNHSNWSALLAITDLERWTWNGGLEIVVYGCFTVPIDKTCVVTPSFHFGHFKCCHPRTHFKPCVIKGCKSDSSPFPVPIRILDFFFSGNGISKSEYPREPIDVQLPSECAEAIFPLLISTGRGKGKPRERSFPNTEDRMMSYLVSRMTIKSGMSLSIVNRMSCALMHQVNVSSFSANFNSPHYI